MYPWLGDITLFPSAQAGLANPSPVFMGEWLGVMLDNLLIPKKIIKGGAN